MRSPLSHLNSVCYFSSAQNILVSPQTWPQDWKEMKLDMKGTYLKGMGKNSVLVWNNYKYQRNNLHDPGYYLPETPINQGQDSLTKFQSMFAEFFKEPDRIHVCFAVATSQQWERWTHQHPGTVVTDT